MSNKLKEKDVMNVLDTCYDKCLHGVPAVGKSVPEMAEDYLKKDSSRKRACKKMLNTQVMKCGTSGLLTGFGGVLTLPVSIPANIGSVLYVQMRMIACTAYMAGYELDSDQTQTFVYACIAGVTINNVIKNIGVKAGEKMVKSVIEKIPGKALTKINKAAGFRFITKFGEKGLINLWKSIPVLGGIVGGGLDIVETKVIAHRAYRWFMEGDFTINDKKDKSVVFVE